MDYLKKVPNIDNSILDAYQLKCIEIWEDCFNNYPFFAQTVIKSGFISRTIKDDKGNYFFDLTVKKEKYPNETVDTKETLVEGCIVLIARSYLREKNGWHKDPYNKKLRGKLTMILKLYKRRKLK